MPLQVPTRKQLIQRLSLRMAGRAVPVTDMTPIGAMRIFIEELADEFLDLYAAIVAEVDAWYIVTSPDPTRRLADYGFMPALARAATGKARFTVTAPSVIPAGLVVRRRPLAGDTVVLQYRTLPNPNNSLGWVIDGTLDVPIQAVAVGTQYNVAANTIIEIDGNVGVPFDATTPVTNPSPLVDGTDGADAAAAVRDFQLFIAANGGNRAAITQAILAYVDPLTSVRPVHSMTFQEWDGNVLLSVDGKAVASIVYVEDGTGSAPGALLEALQVLLDGQDTEELPGIRGAGLRVAVQSAVAFEIPVTVAVDISPDVAPATVQVLVRDTIQRFLTQLPVAGSGPFGSQGEFIFAHLFKAVVDVSGVLRAEFTFPFQDIDLPLGYKCMPGEILVTARSVVA